MTSVHRLLDDAFAGVDLTPEVQDLKEEIRANLAARTAELESAGTTPDTAARRAVDELGDVRGLVVDAQEDVAARTGGVPRTVGQDAFAFAQQQRVRPRPGFVLGVVAAALILVALLAVAGLTAAGVLDLPAVAVVGLLLTAAGAAGFIVGFSLTQETTTNHPMPAARAGGYYLATGLAAFGLLLVLFTIFGSLASWTYAVAGVCAVAGAGLFIVLGVTQTNRRKAWAREQVEVGDRFSREPDVAARFGIFTGVIWVTATVVFLVVGATLGWTFAWLAFVVGWIAMMLLLATMLFPPRRPE